MVVILGILAAIVIPRFAGASIEAKTSSLRSNLRRIRLQIELYKVHHNDNLPSLSNFEVQLTGTTDTAGNSSGADCGPYLMSIPVEPFTNSNAISASSTEGWNYNENTRRFWAPYNPNL